MKENTCNPMLKEQPTNLDSTLPEYVKDYLEKESSNQLNKISNDTIRRVLEWLNDPMNSSKYRNHILFKNRTSLGIDDCDYMEPGFKVEIPLFKMTF